MNYIEFSQNIKKKYPEYNDMDDLDLAKKMVAKFPEYNDITFDDATEKKSVVKSVVDGLEKVGSKVYDGVNRIIEPAVDANRNIKDVVKTAADTAVIPITKVANASVPVNINYKEIEKQPKKVEPILRARTVEDDIVYNKTPIIRARTAYDESPLIIRPAPTPTIRARTRQDDINEVAARVNEDTKGLEHDPIIETVVNPATMLGKGVITKGGLAIFEAIQQAKNAAVSKYKGKDFDLLAYENLTSLLPENTPQALKIAAGLGEMVGDAIIAGKLETATRNFFIRDTADRLKFELEKKGYNENEINDVLSKFYKKIINRQEVKNLENKNLIGKQVEQKPINIDEAISLNKQIRKIEVPQAKPKQESLKADMDIEVVRENSKLNDANELVATKDITSGEIADDIIKEVAPLKKLEKANTIETVRQKVDKKFLTELRQDVVDVLNAGELKNIDFGELSAAKLEALNKIRELNNVELLENNRLVIPANVVKKLIEKRMLKDKMSAEEVADLLIDIFHGDNTKIAGTKHKHIQVMFKVLDKVSKVGFVSKNPANKDTVIKGGYKVDTKRLLNNIIKGEVLDGHGSPSSVLIPEGNKVAAPRNISALQNSPDDIIGQNNDGVNNLESDAIETGNENVDASFEPAEFDEEYANAMEEQQKLLIEEMKENGAIPTIKSEKQRLQDMGIGKILRPKQNDPMYSEYKHLSPRIQREFFYDESDGLVNNSKGYTWDNAEHDLQQATGTDTTIWEELENIDRNIKKYENLGLATGNKNGNAAYSSVLKTGVKVGAEEKPKETDFKLYQRVYDLAKKYMKNNIAESKYRPKNSLGVYYNYGSGKGNIFVKSLNTIDVVSHELVHAIDDELGISRNLLDSGNAVESELIRACKELYPIDMRKRGKEAQLLEGMASLVQHMVVNPEIAKRFPQAANFIRSNEKLNNFVQDARQIVVDYESQNNVQKVKSEIYDKPIKTVKKSKIPLSVKLDSQFFDSEAVLRWLDEDLYIAAKGYKTVLKGIIENNLTNNKGVMYILDSNGNPKKVSDIVNWKTFIEHAEKTGKEFNTFLVARRFFNWYKQRDKLVNLIEIDTNNLKSLVKKLQKTQLVIKNTGLQKELDAAKRLENKLTAEIHRLQNRINSNSEKLHSLKDIIKNHGKDEKLMKDVYVTLNTEQNQKLAADYDFLIDCNLQTLKNAGLIDNAMYKEFSENEGYTPFNKVAYDEIAGDGGLDFVSRFAPNSVNTKNLKKIKGSELPIVSPLYSSVHFMTEAYKKAYRQIVYNKLGEIADMFPEVMQKVQYVQGMEKDSSMIVPRNAKGVRYGVKVDPFIKKVIDGVSNIIRPDWMSNMLLVPSRFFTNMTTGLYPLYAPVNFLRDQVTAFVNSQTNYIPILSAVQTYLNPIYKKYIDEYDNLFGVDNNTLLGTLKDIDPSDLSKAFRESWGKKWIKIGKKIFAFPSNFSETLTRRTEYAKARAKGYSVTESKRMADEITAAFGDRGLWFGNVGQVLTKSIPYFNSALQVIRQAGRAVNSKNVWKFLAATGLIAGAMVATNKSILDSENEEEKRQHMQLMAEQLAMYIYMPNGKADGMIRIPIDQTYSWLGVLMTMLYNQSKGYDYKMSDYVAGATAWLPDQINFFETLTNLLTEKDFSGLQKQIITSIPHLPRTVLSGLFGKRTFPHVMDIVPKRLQRLEPRLQYDNRTSFVAKFLGDKLNVSPMKIDYFIDQGLGRTIRLGTRTTEASYGLLTDDKSWNENLKQMNPFVQQDFFSSGRIVQDFYDIKDNVDRLYISANEGLRKLSDKEMDLLKEYKGYTDSIGKTMSKYNKLVQYMRDNKDKMSESELNSNELKKKRIEKQLFDAIRKMKGWKVEEMSD